MGGYSTFSFGEGDGHVGQKSKAWKAEAGTTSRISFAWWPGLDSGAPNLDSPAPSFCGADTNYILNVGYVVNKGPEYTKLAGDPPRQRIATVIVVWPTDKQGNVNKARLTAGEAEVHPWVISADKYRSLQQVHKEFPFGEHDLTAACTDAQYQKLTFSPCRESLLRTLMRGAGTKSLADQLFADAAKIAASIQDHVGREMTIADIRQKLAGGGSAGAGAGAATAAGNAAATNDIDGLVGDLLDT